VPDLAGRGAVPAVTSGSLGRALVPGLPFEAPDGSPLDLGADALGRPRDPDRPTPGPIEGLAPGEAAVPWG
jgi:hypothetical protein